MSPAQAFLRFSWILVLACGADGFENYAIGRCLFNSTELPDIEFIQSYYYDKVEHLRFNSTVGKYVGYTQLGVMNADRLNNDPAKMAVWRAQLEAYCQHNIKNWYGDVLGKTATPYVTLSSVTPRGGSQMAMLMCSAYDFYPKQISVTWLRDGRPITTEVTSTNEQANGDWYYQIHSQLEYTPRSEERISCMVEHPSLQSPLVKDWDPSLPESDKNKIAIGASGLILGLVLFLAGFIYYKKKSRGRILVPNN